MKHKLTTEQAEEIRYEICKRLRAGFEDPAEMAADVADMIAEDESDCEWLEPHCEAILRKEMDELAKGQVDWPPITDCDRLDAAFDDMILVGILARQNLPCCDTCARDELENEVDELGGLARWKGHVFYHEQNTETAVSEGDLVFGFGVFSEEGSAVDVAIEAVQILEKHGFNPKWDGSEEQKITVPIKWMRRFRQIPS